MAVHSQSGMHPGGFPTHPGWLALYSSLLQRWAGERCWGRADKSDCSTAIEILQEEAPPGERHWREIGELAMCVARELGRPPTCLSFWLTVTYRRRWRLAAPTL